MKALKIFMLAGALAVSGTSFAEESYAPAANDLSLEVQFNPFSNNFTTFQIDQIKARYFFTDNDALRIGLGFGVDSDKVVADPEDEPDAWTKNKTGNFSISLGYERHFFSYKRVDLYAGAGLSYRYNYAGATTQVVGSNDELLKGSMVNLNGNGETSSHVFNVMAFTGVDFYVYKGLYLGAELGIKFGVKSYPSSYQKGGFDDNGKWDEKLEGDKGSSTSNFNLACYAEPALRLGWTF